MERDVNEEMDSLLEGVWWITVWVFSGHDLQPISTGGRLLALVGFVQGLLIATYLIALVAAFSIRGGRVLTRDHRGHVIICGWNYQGKLIVDELKKAQSASPLDFVIVTVQPVPSDVGKICEVIEEDPTQHSGLERAGIRQAKSVIVLTDPTAPATEADARAIMTILAVNNLNKKVHTTVQIMNSDISRVHLEDADVDEIISLDRLAAGLIVASAVSPGVTRIVDELMDFNKGKEFYTLDAPTVVIGKDFKEVAIALLQRGPILIGVEPGSVDRPPKGMSTRHKPKHEREGILINPRPYKIGNKDTLFVIASSPSQLRHAVDTLNF